ncbi:hypothetical protein [Nocardioides daphniae]|nr:hypothetical protein [Nocardioides daphniae]
MRQVVLAGVAEAEPLRPALAAALAIGGAGWRYGCSRRSRPA